MGSAHAVEARGAVVVGDVFAVGLAHGQHWIDANAAGANAWNPLVAPGLEEEGHLRSGRMTPCTLAGSRTTRGLSGLGFGLVGRPTRSRIESIGAASLPGRKRNHSSPSRAGTLSRRLASSPSSVTASNWLGWPPQGDIRSAAEGPRCVGRRPRSALPRRRLQETHVGAGGPGHERQHRVLMPSTCQPAKDPVPSDQTPSSRGRVVPPRRMPWLDCTRAPAASLTSAIDVLAAQRVDRKRAARPDASPVRSSSTGSSRPRTAAGSRCCPGAAAADANPTDKPRRRAAALTLSGFSL